MQWITFVGGTKSYFLIYMHRWLGYVKKIQKLHSSESSTSVLYTGSVFFQGCQSDCNLNGQSRGQKSWGGWYIVMSAVELTHPGEIVIQMWHACVWHTCVVTYMCGDSDTFTLKPKVTHPPRTKGPIHSISCTLASAHYSPARETGRYKAKCSNFNHAPLNVIPKVCCRTIEKERLEEERGHRMKEKSYNWKDKSLNLPGPEQKQAITASIQM